MSESSVSCYEDNEEMLSVDLSDEERPQSIEHNNYHSNQKGGIGPRKAFT
jgi:hypothetical protein